MSGGKVCICKENKDLSFQLKNWVIRQYKCNHSAFNGWKYTPSDYSALNCLVCGSVWRTKAGYVSSLRIESYQETKEKNNLKET